MARLALVVGALLVVTAGPVMAADSPVGRWNTVDEKSGKVRSTVEIYEHGGKVFGKIVGLAEPYDDTGKARLCRKCTGGDKDKPLVGIVIVKDLSAVDGRYQGGTIMDPENGKTYTAELWVDGETLKVRGYLAFFYRTQTWVKSK